MATLASNQLGIYAIDGGSTSPLTVHTGGVTDANPSGVSNGDKVLVIDSNGDFVGFATAGSSNLAALDVAAGDLLAAATTTTLDASNTINEVAARDGVGSSTNFIASGAFAFTFSIDGLIDLTANTGGDTGSPITLLDLAKDSMYVLVRFTTKIGSDSGGGLGDDAGVVSYVGQALIESCSLTGGVDDIATYSATFRGYGKLHKEIAS
jgi:hypothetical protein